jgi:NarL family two-component system response regulator YdfI
VWAMKKRIVIVDHHVAVRELLCHYLERSPEYEVVGQAGTGLEAVRLLNATFTNVLLIELVLPELCGREVISRVRREIPGIQIVVFTGASDTSMLAKALRSEPNGFVSQIRTARDSLVRPSYRECWRALFLAQSKPFGCPTGIWGDASAVG